MITIHRPFSAVILSLLLAFGSLYASQTYRFPMNQIGPDGLAAGWEDNSAWADVDVEYRADQVFEELKAQRVTVTDIRSGRVQLKGPDFSVKAGYIYTVSVRLRSLDGMASVMLFIREAAAPYRDKVAERVIEATPDWATQSFFFEAQESKQGFPIYFAFSSRCDVVIERIDILEESREEFDKRMSEVSDADGVFLHPNPGFMLGKAGYTTTAFIDRERQYPQRTGEQYSLNPPEWSLRADADGGADAIVEIGENNTMLLTTLSDLLPAREVTAMARVRLSEGSAPVTLGFFGPAWPNAPRETFTVGTEWTLLEISGEAPMNDSMQARAELFVFGEGLADAQLEIDYLILTHDPAQAKEDIVGALPAAFVAEPDRELTFYVVGDDPVVSLYRTGGAGEVVSWRVVDTQGEVARTGTWTLSGAGGENAPQKHHFDGLPIGWWQLQWDAPWADEPAGVVNFAIVPPIARTAGSASPFGIHVEGSEYGLAKMNYMGIQWLRTNNPLWTKWTAVQPERDTWVYPDRFVDLFTDAGKDILFNLDRTPRWAARNPENYRRGTDYMDFRADLPGDWPAWEEYVSRMVERYQDRIQYWEIWNEPDIPFLRPPEGVTNAQAYIQLLEHSAPLIREIDPSAKIVMSPAYYLKKRSNPEGYQEDFTQRFIEDGGMQYVDVYSVHFYLTYGQRVFDRPDMYEQQLDTVLEAMMDAGRPDPQIWNSEWGIINFTIPTHPVNLPSTNGITPEQSARELVVWSVGMLAAGLEKLFWYDGQDNYFYHFHVTKNLFDYKQPRPAAVSYAVLTWKLDALSYEGEDAVPGDAGRVIAFSDDAGERKVLVAYANLGQRFSLSDEDVLKATDFMGKELSPVDGQFLIGENPVYLELAQP